MIYLVLLLLINWLGIWMIFKRLKLLIESNYFHWEDNEEEHDGINTNIKVLSDQINSIKKRLDKKLPHTADSIVHSGWFVGDVPKSLSTRGSKVKWPKL